MVNGGSKQELKFQNCLSNVSLQTYQPKTARNKALLTLFDVSCVKCDSANLKFICEFDDDSGETAVYLFCPRCRLRERLKL
jgi:hypothetical protein